MYDQQKVNECNVFFVNKSKIRPAHECNQENSRSGDRISYREVKNISSNIPGTFYYVEIKYLGSEIKIIKFKLRGIPL